MAAVTVQKTNIYLQNLEVVVTDLYKRGLNSCAALEKEPKLKEQFDVALYHFLEYAFSTKTALKLADCIRRKYGWFETSDYVNSAYIGLYSPLKHGASRGSTRLDSHFFSYEHESFIPRLFTYLYRTIMLDSLKKRGVLSLDTPSGHEDDDSGNITYDITPSAINVEAEALSSVACLILIEQAAKVLHVHPDEFLAFAQKFVCGGRLTSIADIDFSLGEADLLNSAICGIKAICGCGINSADADTIRFENLDKLSRLADMPVEARKKELSRCASRARKKLCADKFFTAYASF